MLEVIAVAAQSVESPNAVDPFLAERVVEERAAVVHGACLDRFAPVDAVGRGHDEAGERGYARRVGFADQHLVARRFVVGVGVDPGRARVGMQVLGQHQVGAGHDIEFGSLPMDAVVAKGQGHLPEIAGHVPHLEDAVAVVEPDAAAFGDRAWRQVGVALVARLGKEDRVAGVLHRVGVDARHRSGLDEEVVDEELAAEVDGDRGGRIFEIGHAHGLARERIAVGGRPLFGEFDSVGEGFAGHGLLQTWRTGFPACPWGYRWRLRLAVASIA